MAPEEFKRLAKRLVNATTQSSWASTMNLLLVSVGARDAYYNDDDIPFFTFSSRYQKAFLELATHSNIGIQFETSGRWLLYNRSVRTPVTTSHSELGKLLKFPCSSKAMDIAKQTSQKVGVEFRIRTEQHDTLVTQFFCFKRELAKISKWFQAMRTGLSFLNSLRIFQTFQPILRVETYELKGNSLVPKELKVMSMEF